MTRPTAHPVAAKWRFRLLTAAGEPGPWRHAASMDDVTVEAVEQRRHVQVHRRAGSRAAGYRYVRYGFVAPDGAKRRSTSMTVTEYRYSLSGCTVGGEAGERPAGQETTP